LKSNRAVYFMATLLVLGITKEALTDSNDNVTRSDAVLRCEIRGSKGEKNIGPSEHIQFTLRSSQDGLKIFAEENSWGYFARSFDAWEYGIEKKLRVIYKVQRRERPWAGNAPTTDILNKGKPLTTDIDLCDGTWIATPSLPENAPFHLVLSPAFEIKSDADTVRLGVWAGQVTGEPKDIFLEKGCILKLNGHPTP
jgi:hypothetical protein